MLLTLADFYCQSLFEDTVIRFWNFDIFQSSCAKKIAMTKLVSPIIKDYLEKNGGDGRKTGGLDGEKGLAEIG